MFRSRGQLQAVRCLVARQSHILYVAPTGQGKTIVPLMAMKLWPSHIRMVIILPYVLLYQEMHERFQKAGITVGHWSLGSTSLNARVITVGVESARHPSFVNFVERIADMGNLGALVMDEAHGLVEDPSWRADYSLLSRLTTINTVFLLLTATAPPAFTPRLWETLNIKYNTPHTCVEIRESTVRPNLTYQLVPPIPSEFNHHHSLLSVLVHMRDLLTGPDRGVVFVYSPSTATKLANDLKCGFVTGPLTPTARHEAMERWKNGTDPCDRLIIMTKAGFYGWDYPNIRFSVHVDAPLSITEWAQATGRVGRDGGRSLCVVFTGHPADAGLVDEDWAGHQGVTRLMSGDECVRHVSTGHLDGRAQDCPALSQETPSLRICSYCHALAPTPITLWGNPLPVNDWYITQPRVSVWSLDSSP